MPECCIRARRTLRRRSVSEYSMTYKNNNWDCIILTHDQLRENYPTYPRNTARKYIRKEIDSIEENLAVFEQRGQ